jgi:hypothetical protein
MFKVEKSVRPFTGRTPFSRRSTERPLTSNFVHSNAPPATGVFYRKDSIGLGVYRFTVLLAL